MELKDAIVCMNLLSETLGVGPGHETENIFVLGYSGKMSIKIIYFSSFSVYRKKNFSKGTFVPEDKLLSNPNSSLKVLLVMLNKEVQKNAFFQKL